MLRDLLAEDLRLVICGSAAGARSARLGHYYAGRGNKFWRMLYAAGITPRVLDPSEWETLLSYGVGLTDVVKGQSGMDRDLDFGRSDPEGLREKIALFRPKVLCFNGKRAARTFLGETVEYGLVRRAIGQTMLFVAPSTSAAAARFWNLATWVDAAKFAGFTNVSAR